MTWMGGLFFTRDEFDAVNDVQSLDLGALLLESNPLIWTIDQETDAWAAFGNIDWYLSDQVHPERSDLRYTDEQTEVCRWYLRDLPWWTTPWAFRASCSR